MDSNPEFDAYIENAQPFARQILTHLRKLARTAEPEAIEEFRWKAPFWILEGRQLCGMATFKRHCAFIIDWDNSPDAMGNFGKITSLSDLPSDDELVALIKEKGARIRSGEDKRARRASNRKPKPVLETPPDLAAAIAETPGAKEVFDNFTDAQLRDYVEWIVSAKREATRAKRVSTAAEWISEGKRRNWKYEKC